MHCTSSASQGLPSKICSDSTHELGPAKGTCGEGVATVSPRLTQTTDGAVFPRGALWQHALTWGHAGPGKARFDDFL
ncbi:hypothetical protein E2C01_038066 [Portunus trituberculatus]|uniref:Uncharacterized protein n=1 Tax=Portunus trituberculatus TaxID=210409 RepID=A0A5B7FH03_PORTR|nr:hypothetical protein [Portunus trituberculatus]